MPHPVRTMPTRPRAACRPPALAGLLLGAVLVVTGCGARSLTDAATVADRQSAGRLVSLCPTPGESRAACDAERVEADIVARRGSASVEASVAASLVDAAASAAFGANVRTVPTEPPTTTAAPTTVAAPAPAPAPEEAAEPEPEEEEPEPEETAPPTTRKPTKSTTTAAPAPAPAPPPDDTTPDTQPPAAPIRVDTSVTGRVVTLVNAQRAAGGLGPVAANGALMSAAARQSKDQATMGKVSHTGIDGSSIGQRCSAAGYGWRALAENAAAGYGSADSVMNGWMGSPGHQANIMNPSFVHIGVAVAYSANGTAYWTMDLGAPA